jgi:hypothetical protein
MRRRDRHVARRRLRSRSTESTSPETSRVASRPPALNPANFGNLEWKVTVDNTAPKTRWTPIWTLWIPVTPTDIGGTGSTLYGDRAGEPAERRCATFIKRTRSVYGRQLAPDPGRDPNTLVNETGVSIPRREPGRHEAVQLRPEPDEGDGSGRLPALAGRSTAPIPGPLVVGENTTSSRRATTCWTTPSLASTPSPMRRPSGRSGSRSSTRSLRS